MTLEELIKKLEKENPEKVIKNGFKNPHSYRGYYEQLAFEPTENVSVKEMLKDAKSALGKTFEGYKGGDFKMWECTEVNLAFYGDSDGNNDALSERLLDYMLKDVVETEELKGE